MVSWIFALSCAASAQPSTALTEALELQRQGKVDEAVVVLRAASEAAPAEAAVRNMLGALLNRSGRYPEALTHALAAVTHAPDNPRYRLNRGIVLVEHGRFTEAVADFDFALERDGSFIYGYLERGSALLSLNRDAEARAQWALARTNDPQLVWPEWYEGLHDFIDGRYASAAARIDRVAAAEPAFSPALVWGTLARARAHLPWPSAAPQDGAWPAPLYRLQRGQLTLAQALAIAEQDQVTGDRRRVGETLFVAAEIAAVAGRAAEARSLYDRAAAVPAPRHAWKVAAERLRAAQPTPLVRGFVVDAFAPGRNEGISTSKTHASLPMARRLPARRSRVRPGPHRPLASTRRPRRRHSSPNSYQRRGCRARERRLPVSASRAASGRRDSQD